MYEIKAGLKGIAPLLINGFLEDAKSGKKSVEEYRAEALRKLHKDQSEFCCLTSEMIKSCLIYGSSMAGIKEGRKSIGQFLKATVFIEPRNISLGQKEPDFIDERMGRIPPGPRGNAVMLYRPGFETGWQVEFNLLVTDDKRMPDVLKSCLESAGHLAAVGAGRPDNGRFDVIKWEIVKNVRKS